jgi:hypothetical protein
LPGPAGTAPRVTVPPGPHAAVDAATLIR